jgi:hypothetical protein
MSDDLGSRHVNECSIFTIESNAEIIRITIGFYATETS